MREIYLSDEEITTLIRALDHVISRARNSGLSGYDIDTLCRRECLARWGILRARLNSKLPKKERM